MDLAGEGLHSERERQVSGKTDAQWLIEAPTVKQLAEIDQ
jgi:hypothetical protein